VLRVFLPIVNGRCCSSAPGRLELDTPAPDENSHPSALAFCREEGSAQHRSSRLAFVAESKSGRTPAVKMTVAKVELAKSQWAAAPEIQEQAKLQRMQGLAQARLLVGAHSIYHDGVTSIPSSSVGSHEYDARRTLRVDGQPRNSAAKRTAARVLPRADSRDYKQKRPSCKGRPLQYSL
jgi:hypothetical protein